MPPRQRAASKLPDLVIGFSQAAGHFAAELFRHDPVLANKVEKALMGNARRVSGSQWWTDAKNVARLVAQLDGVLDFVLTNEAREAMGGAGARPGPSSAPSPYAILGVMPDAPWEVIQAAWKAQCVKHHPDRGGSEERMKVINEAMEAIRKERGL